MERQRLVVNETTDKVDFLQSKLLTIEKHLPVMIQEILEYYFEKKVSDVLASMVTKEQFREALSVKLDYSIFRDYEKMVGMDRSQEQKNFTYEEKLHELERKFRDYVTKEDLAVDLRDKVSFARIDELVENFSRIQSGAAASEEKLSAKIADLKSDLESKTKEMLDQIEDLNQKMDEIEEEDGSYDDEEESDQDLDSELGDTLDVNDMNRQVDLEHREREQEASGEEKRKGEMRSAGESGEESPES